ncbi:MAG TPA: hypothetical protein PKW84_01950 [Fervidobacterium sp.]|jgi:hypothetical protein|nr:hypothetical protein [Thermotogaceae bacterium]HOA16483.1 hypothetical protein [Fervidobacterium sp.]HOH52867.1 hypothetical protein [Fervidobacterium sp.]HQO04867.1 hypothetical protein [Fervidobacterium sp.]HQQ17547.1 hypothetical protein [Fervidobacterium sp.]
MPFAVWVTSISSIFVDNVFREYYCLTPLYFFLESVSTDDKKIKIARLILFSLLYQSFALRQINILWIIITFAIIVIELYRDNFYYGWSASLVQMIIFIVPFYYDNPLSLVYGFVVDTLLFIYIYKKLELGGV